MSELLFQVIFVYVECSIRTLCSGKLAVEAEETYKKAKGGFICLGSFVKYLGYSVSIDVYDRSMLSTRNYTLK